MTIFFRASERPEFGGIKYFIFPVIIIFLLPLYLSRIFIEEGRTSDSLEISLRPINFGDTTTRGHSPQELEDFRSSDNKFIT